MLDVDRRRKPEYGLRGWCGLFVGLWVVFLFHLAPVRGADQQPAGLPDALYADLEYIFSVVKNESEIDPAKLTGIIDFVRSTTAGTSYGLAEREGSQGAFYAFTLASRFADLMRYGFNPDIPPYLSMPSSLRHHRWLTPEVPDRLRSLINGAGSDAAMQVLRGAERETITPDINTGGYYTYDHDRILWLMPDPAGPVVISATVQRDRSDIGMKGCVVGDDGNWDYLYSEQPGLTKTGLGWVDSFMYRAASVTVYVGDPDSLTIHAGAFKWLNAGWAKINMVKSRHILNGIKRFAHDFKAIIESPNLPEADEFTQRYKALQEMEETQLRQLVAPYLERLEQTQKIGECSKSFAALVASGEYLEQMDSQDLIRILLLEYLKRRLDGGAQERIGLHDAAASVPVDS